jgi:hypothetical protein
MLDLMKQYSFAVFSNAFKTNRNKELLTGIIA